MQEWMKNVYKARVALLYLYGCLESLERHGKASKTLVK